MKVNWVCFCVFWFFCTQLLIKIKIRQEFLDGRKPNTSFLLCEPHPFTNPKVDQCCRKGVYMARHPQASRKENKKVTFHTYNRYFYMHYPEKHIVQFHILFLSDLCFYAHLFCLLFIKKKKKPHLFPSLPDFLIIPYFEDKQYLEQIHSLQMGDILF